MSKKEKNIEQKTLFDHLKAITNGRNPNYWDTLTDGDKKTWSTYMINRFLSMNMNWVDLVAELDPYTTGIQLEPKLVFQLYYDLIPKSNTFLKYIKGKSENKFNKELINLMRSHFEVSSKESIEYLNILFDSIDGVLEVKNLLKSYAYDESEIKKLIKVK